MEAARAIYMAVESRVGYWEMGYALNRVELFVGNINVMETLLRADKVRGWREARSKMGTSTAGESAELMEKQCANFMKALGGKRGRLTHRAKVAPSNQNSFAPLRPVAEIAADLGESIQGLGTPPLPTWLQRVTLCST